jgi:hypothetical protein
MHAAEDEERERRRRGEARRRQKEDAEDAVLSESNEGDRVFLWSHEVVSKDTVVG